MPPANVRPVAEAVAVFRRLGYDVSDEGPEFRARRKWRTVHVTVLDGAEATTAPSRLADGGQPDDQLRCHVAWLEHAERLAAHLDAASDGDWVVIGVDESGGHEVVGA